MKYLQVLILLAAVLVVGGVLAQGHASEEWGENFDTYATGSGIIGQGGWEGWDGNTTTDAWVSDNQVFTGINSLHIDTGSNVVYQFSELYGNAFLFEIITYNPSDATGNSYINVLVEYTHGGPYSWATQLEFGGGFLRNIDTGEQLPLLTDQWIYLVIEFAHGTSRIIYDGTQLSSTGFPSPINIAAFNVSGDDGSEMYIDNIFLDDTTLPTMSTTLSRIKSLY